MFCAAEPVEIIARPSTRRWKTGRRLAARHEVVLCHVPLDRQQAADSFANPPGMKDHGGMKRREFLKSSLGAVVILQSRPQPDLVLTNGKFVDGRGVVGSTMTIRNGRIVRIGQAMQLAPDAQRIDLGGRTVIPGFFDAHVHYTRAGLNPGYEARRIERASSIAELQEAIARRAESVPAGQFITCIGGWNHTQFAEARRPTKAELDAATSRHPIYISGTGGGTGAITNSLGQAFFASKGVMVDAGNGAVPQANAALAALQALQTPEDKLRSTADLNAHANSLGLTGVINASNIEDQEFPLKLWRQDKLTIRMRPLFRRTRPRMSRRASQTTSAREGAPSATICSGYRASAKESAATARLQRSSSRRQG